MAAMIKNNLSVLDNALLVSLTVGQFKELMESMFPKEHNEIQEIIDINKVCEITGYSPNTIYSKTSRRVIPHFKRENRLYFYRSEIEVWMTEHKIKTSNEICMELDQRLVSRKN